MTVATPRIGSRREARQQHSLLFAAALAGCVSLTGRGIAWRAIWMTLAVGAAAVLAPAASRRRASLPVCIGAAVVGIAAFAFVRSQLVVLPSTVTVVAGAATLVAAVAEEFFFRRLMYDALARWGPTVAIAGSALAFAAIHVPAYGFVALPIDVAAGVLLGWQRWITGTVVVPALTHIAANLLSIL